MRCPRVSVLGLVGERAFDASRSLQAHNLDIHELVLPHRFLFGATRSICGVKD